MKSEPWHSNVVRHVLSNGLTLLVERNPSAPVISVVTHVRAGYFDEPDHWVGISHVLEHMYFKGSVNFGPGQLAAETQRLGGYVNAGTIYDKTVYYASLPSGPGVLRRGVELQADALLRLSLDADELSRELEVIIQEAKRKQDSPQAVVSETLNAVLFAQHRIRRWRIGTEEGLRKITADDVRAYYESRYVPSRTIVGIVGDIDVDEAIEIANACYGTWPEATVEVESSPLETNPPKADLRIMRGDVQQPLFAVGWRTEGVDHPDSPVLDVFAGAVGQGRGSHLYRQVRGAGLASSVTATNYASLGIGLFSVSVKCDLDTTDDAMTRALEVCRAVGDDGLYPEDVERVRSMTAVAWARRIESLDARAMLLCEFEAQGSFVKAQEYVDRLMTVTVDEVRDVARRYVDSRPSAVLYLPDDADQPHWSWPLNVTRRDLSDSSSIPPPAANGARVEGEARAAGWDVLHVRGDGVDLVGKSKLGGGVALLGVYALGFRDGETSSNAGITSLFVRTALRGTTTKNAEQLSLAAEALGGTISPSLVGGAVGWTMLVAAKRLGAAATLLGEVAKEHELDRSEFERERRLQSSDAARARDDMFGYPQRKVLHLAFPEEAFGLPVLGESTRVSQMTLQEIQETSQRFRDSRLTVLTVGDHSPDELFRQVADLQRWPGRECPPTAKEAKWVADHGVEPRDKEQTALAMAFQSPDRGSSDFPVATVMCTVLSGMSGRLFLALRDKKSLAYTVRAAPFAREHAGAVLTYIATSPEREDEARNQMLMELERLANDRVSADELERARNQAAGAIQLRQQTVASVASEVLDGWIFSQLDEMANQAERLRSVTAEDVRRLAAQVFDPTSRCEFVLRGGSARAR